MTTEKKDDAGAVATSGVHPIPAPPVQPQSAAPVSPPPAQPQSAAPESAPRAQPQSAPRGPVPPVQPHSVPPGAVPPVPTPTVPSVKSAMPGGGVQSTSSALGHSLTCGCTPPKKNIDKLLMMIATIVLYVAAILAWLGEGQKDNDSARINLLALAFLTASSIIALVESNQKKWAFFVAIAGFILWGIGVINGANGDLGALLDVFRVF